ncbi:MAG: hypothetical protein HQ562_06945 [Candidatus Marinimicrobia bacterium]|nr:hypothetical protein [Candidatus Neomarinimicrobiota bacterium]
MRFCTTINCMDGRVQLPVINYLRDQYRVEYVDSITEPGPIKIIAERQNSTILDNILLRIDISVKKHGSGLIAVVGHHDCAGNPESKAVQVRQIEQSINFLQKKYPDVELMGLWVDENWAVHELDRL